MVKKRTKNNNSTDKISAFGLKILRRLKAVGSLKVIHGAAPAALRHIPLTIANELLSRGLIEVSVSTNSARLSEAGVSYLRRLEAAEKKRSMRSVEEVNVFARQHQIIGKIRIIRDGKIETHAANMAESPLGWLRARKDKDGRPFISAEQFEAGERLRADFERAGMLPRITGQYDAVYSGYKYCNHVKSDLLPTEQQQYARQRVEAALDALGSGLSDVALRVCCFLESVSSTENKLGWPARSAKVVLRIALDKLVDHYKNNHIG